MSLWSSFSQVYIWFCLYGCTLLGKNCSLKGKMWKSASELLSCEKIFKFTDLLMHSCKTKLQQTNDLSRKMTNWEHFSSQNICQKGLTEGISILLNIFQVGINYRTSLVNQTQPVRCDNSTKCQVHI